MAPPSIWGCLAEPWVALPQGHPGSKRFVSGIHSWAPPRQKFPAFFSQNGTETHKDTPSDQAADVFVCLQVLADRRGATAPGADDRKAHLAPKQRLGLGLKGAVYCVNSG